MKIKKITSEDNNYLHYPQQTLLQPAFVEVDLRSGEIWSGCNPDLGGGMPGYVWEGKAYRWGVNPRLTVGAINNLLQEISELPELAAAIDAYENGDDEAFELFQEIGDWIDQREINLPQTAVWTWAEWFENINIISELANHESLESFEKSARDDADCADGENVIAGDTADLVAYIAEEVSYVRDPKLPSWALKIEEIKAVIED